MAKQIHNTDALARTVLDNPKSTSIAAAFNAAVSKTYGTKSRAAWGD